jgi:hypothetical protein
MAWFERNDRARRRRSSRRYASTRVRAQLTTGIAIAGVALASLAGALGGCEDPATPGPDGGGGGGGEGGCPAQPKPLYTVTITTPGKPVPPDTTLHVVWSAGEETFALDNPSTWKTLDDGINVVCAVQRDAGPPTDLDELVCQLWTTGATEVEVTANGYMEHEETLRPLESELCDAVPADVTVVLQPLADAGS